MLQSMARTETEVKNLSQSVRELKDSVEELVDRLEGDIDTLRDRTGKVELLEEREKELRRRVDILEAKHEESRQVQDKTNTKIAFASGGVAVLSVLLKVLWK